MCSVPFKCDRARRPATLHVQRPWHVCVIIAAAAPAWSAVDRCDPSTHDSVRPLPFVKLKTCTPFAGVLPFCFVIVIFWVFVFVDIVRSCVTPPFFVCFVCVRIAYQTRNVRLRRHYAVVVVRIYSASPYLMFWVFATVDTTPFVLSTHRVYWRYVCAPSSPLDHYCYFIS